MTATDDISAVLIENDVTRRFLDPGRGGTRSLAARNADYEHRMRGVGERGLLCFNRPVFLDEQTATGLGRDLDGIFTLLTALPAKLFDGTVTAMMRALDVPEAQLHAMARIGGHQPPVRLGRADLFQDPEGFKLLEFNASCSLGGWDLGVLNQSLVADPEFAGFMRRENLVVPDTLGMIIDAMAGELGLTVAPGMVIALADYPHTIANTRPFLRNVSDLLRQRDIKATPCHIGELVYRDGGVYLADEQGGDKVDVVFRLFLPHGLVDDEHPEVHPLLDRLHGAVERGEVGLFADFSLDLYGHKGCLALMSDERNRAAFTAEELDLIDRLIPFTRLVRDEDALIGGETVALVEYIAANRERLLLKPAFLYGGQGIVAGWKVDDEQWRAAIQTALQGPYVVQERVQPTFERFIADGTDEFERWILNWGVYLTPAGYAGAFIRGSQDADADVISLRQGALHATVFHVDSTQADSTQADSTQLGSAHVESR